jgi:xanthine dehydrogenase accessory factor
VADARRVLFRGAGDFASGGIRRVRLAGFSVVATELPRPLCVRRTVAFSEAVYEGAVTVEGVAAERCGPDEVETVLGRGAVAVLVDPEGDIRRSMAFPMLVDARVAKRNLGTTREDAPFVVGVGPGFTAGADCHAAVETDASHDLGRVIWDGPTAAYRKSAGPPESYLLPFLKAGSAPPAWDWNLILLRAPRDGVFEGLAEIGDIVDAGQETGTVDGEPVCAQIRGLLRGLLRSGTPVRQGQKLGDVDPVIAPHKVRTMSEKANAIGGGILEAVMTHWSKTDQRRAPS